MDFPVSRGRRGLRFIDGRAPDFATHFAALLADRAASGDVRQVVADILAQIRRDGDAALCALTARFDRLALSPATMVVSAAEIDAAVATVESPLAAALDLAASRIEAFARAQLPADLQIHDEAGVTMGMRWTPVDAAGLYVPGGKAAYPSSVLMNAIPARVAGVERLVMCVPCPDGVLNPLVLAAARRAGVTEIYRVGGAQAVAAMAYGTATIMPVDCIVGPGNMYVAEAKRQVFGQVGIDSVAGPSEVVIVADALNDAAHVAMDLLAQAEHDQAAQAVLLTDNPEFGRAVAAAVQAALPTLPRAAIAAASWAAHGAIVVVADWAQAARCVDRLAPEHLQIMLAEPEPFFLRIRHAGAAFLGRFTPEALGDYIAGPNHVLPTGRTARHASGLSVYDFLKRTTWIETDRAGLEALAPAAAVLAEAEGLHAHAASLRQRLV